MKPKTYIYSFEPVDSPKGYERHICDSFAEAIERVHDQEGNLKEGCHMEVCLSVCPDAEKPRERVESSIFYDAQGVTYAKDAVKERHKREDAAKETRA